MSELKKDIKNLLLHVGYYKKLNEQVIEPTGDDDNVGGSNWDNPDTLIDYGNVWGDDIVLPGDGSNDDDYIYIPNITPDENYIDDEFDYDFNVNNPNLTYNPDSFQFYNMNCNDYGCMDSNAYNFNANAGPWPWCGTYCHYDSPIDFYSQNYNDESYACTIMSQETGGNFYPCYVLDGFTYNPGGGNTINNYQVQCCQMGIQGCATGFGCTGYINPQQISSVIENMTSNESCTPENTGCRDPQYANFDPAHECDCDNNYLGQWVMGGFKGDTHCCNNDRCNTGEGPIWSESPACKDGNTIGTTGPVVDTFLSGSGCKDPEAINFNPNNMFLNHDPKDCEYRGENPNGMDLEMGWETDTPTPDSVEIRDDEDEEEEEFNVTIDRVTPDWENPKDKKSKSKPSSPVISGETKTNKIKKDVKVKPTKEKLNEAKKCKIGKKCGGPDCHGCTWTWMFNKCTCSYGGMTPAGTNDWEKSISNDTPNIVKDKLREEFTRMKTIWKYRI